MIFVVVEVPSKKTDDPVHRVQDLFVGEATPEDLDQPVIREFLKIDDKGSLIDFPGKSESNRPVISLYELMRISFHVNPLSAGSFCHFTKRRHQIHLKNRTF
jgi:hypothetical protein